jgi:hypothetical protein
MAGLFPATPIMWQGGASLSGVAGTSPAMTCAIVPARFEGEQVQGDRYAADVCT